MQLRGRYGVRLEEEAEAEAEAEALGSARAVGGCSDQLQVQAAMPSKSLTCTAVKLARPTRWSSLTHHPKWPSLGKELWAAQYSRKLCNLGAQRCWHGNTAASATSEKTAMQTTR